MKALTPLTASVGISSSLYLGVEANIGVISGGQGSFTGPVSSSIYYGDGSQLINIPTGDGLTFAQVSGAITSSIANFPTRTEASGAITGALTPYATLSGVSASFVTPSQTSGAISSFPTRTEVTGVLNDYATLTGVSSSFVTPSQASSSISGAIVNFATRTETSGAITASLVPYATLAGVSASFATPSQVSSSITGALTPYATLSGVSSSFTTPSQVSGAIANFPTRTEVTGALNDYATLSGVSSSFSTPNQVSGAVTGAISNFPTRTEVSGAVTSSLSGYATLSGVSASFTTPSQVSSSITGALIPYATLAGVSSSFATPSQISGAITGFPTRTETSGAITASLTNYARVDQQNTFTVSQVISGNLTVTGNVSASMYYGDASGLTNLPASGVPAVEISGAITGAISEFPTRTEVTGALNGYVTLSGVSASFTTPAQVSGAITDFPTRTETSGAITASLVPYWSGSQTAVEVSGAITGALNSIAVPNLSGNLTFYISTTGSDSGTGDINDSWLTIQHAIDYVTSCTKDLGTQVTLKISPGTYSSFVIQDTVFDERFGLSVEGDISASSATGLMSGTIDADINYNTIQVIGAGWTPNELVGKFFRTSGSWTDAYPSPIVSNTSDTITFVLDWMGNVSGSGFEIVEPAVTINDTYTINNVFSKQGIFPTSAGAGFHVSHALRFLNLRSVSLNIKKTGEIGFYQCHMTNTTLEKSLALIRSCYLPSLMANFYSELDLAYVLIGDIVATDYIDIRQEDPVTVTNLTLDNYCSWYSNWSLFCLSSLSVRRYSSGYFNLKGSCGTVEADSQFIPRTSTGHNYIFIEDSDDIYSLTSVTVNSSHNKITLKNSSGATVTDLTIVAGGTHNDIRITSDISVTNPITFGPSETITTGSLQTIPDKTIISLASSNIVIGTA
jgi:hypothetical protein